jgi:hypothetical protein
MTSPLERLTGTGRPLAAEPPDAKEFEGLKRSGLARLKDAPQAFTASDTMGCSPTPTARPTSPPLANSWIRRHRSGPSISPQLLPPRTAHNPPSCADTAVRR